MAAAPSQFITLQVFNALKLAMSGYVVHIEYMYTFNVAMATYDKDRTSGSFLKYETY